MTHVEKPEAVDAAEMAWGSDVVAEALRTLGIEYVSLNPGASYRGLHDSLVNYLGNERPRMLMCLHEEHAVAIAHGYAKVTDHPMAVAIHSNVGLMHASMAIFNAYCDRAPMLMLGATGPVDAAARRPWIDWLHTTADQGALIRNFTKWDDQPVSVTAAATSLARAYSLTAARPSAPTYVCLDFSTQETDAIGDADVESLKSLELPTQPSPSQRVIQDVVDRIRKAQRPLLLLGRVTRDERAWRERVAVAEALDVPVLTHQKLGAAFPTGHRLHALDPVTHRSPDAQQLIRESDLLVSFDWLDLGGMLVSAGVGRAGDGPEVMSFSADVRLHNGWSKDHFDFPYTSLTVEVDPDTALAAFAEYLGLDVPEVHPVVTSDRPRDERVRERPQSGWSELVLGDLADAVLEATRGLEPSFIRLPSAWPADRMRWDHPLDYLGCDGGEGIGSGPGMAVGGALALRDSGRLPVAILGDGDFLMGATALWTGAHYDVPLLMIVANNSSYLNDEIHQTHIARVRGRPASNAWIGQRMTEPVVDVAGLARAQGWEAFGPVTDQETLGKTLHEAVAAVRGGARVLIDVRVEVELSRAPRIVDQD